MSLMNIGYEHRKRIGFTVSRCPPALLITLIVLTLSGCHHVTPPKTTLPSRSQPVPFHRPSKKTTKTITLRIAYKVRDVGTLGGKTSSANGINDRGDVTGTAARHNRFDHAYLYRNGRMQDIGALSTAHGSEGLFINNRDAIAGVTTDDRGFFWSGGRMRPFHLLNRPDDQLDVQAAGLNDANTIVGTVDASSYYVGYIWHRKTVKSLADRYHTETKVEAINNRGDYVWWLGGKQGNKNKTLLHHNQRDSLIVPPAGFREIKIAAINNRGDMVGVAADDIEAEDFPTADSKAIIRTHGKLSRLSMIAEYPYVIPKSINEVGKVVGACFDRQNQDSRAFYYDGHTLYDLNSLIDPRSGWVLQSAASINNRGQIVGTGKHHGVKRGFILTPIK